jgi:hypothetical protein
MRSHEWRDVVDYQAAIRQRSAGVSAERHWYLAGTWAD